MTEHVPDPHSSRQPPGEPGEPKPPTGYPPEPGKQRRLWPVLLALVLLVVVAALLIAWFGTR